MLYSMLVAGNKGVQRIAHCVWQLRATHPARSVLTYLLIFSSLLFRSVVGAMMGALGERIESTARASVAPDYSEQEFLGKRIFDPRGSFYFR